MKHNQKIGKAGEDLAVKYLLKQGYEILSTNFRVKCGEIDIVAIKNDRIIFCEVKTRSSLKYGVPSSSVNSSKREHIIRVAQCFLKNGQWADFCPRFDVIEVYYFDKGRINHMIGAFVIDN